MSEEDKKVAASFLPILFVLGLPIAAIVFCGLMDAALERIHGKDENKSEGPEDMGF
jgi:hypothetical protein